MRIFCMLLAALLLQGGLLAPEKAADVVVVVDVSGMTLEEAGSEPWLASPCLNPAHVYLRLAGIASSGESYPAGAGVSDVQRKYHFRTCFLLEEEALGWRPWECHYEIDSSGAPVKITDAQAAGCIFASQEARVSAANLIAALLEENAARRVALCCVGGPYDERFCVNFTRDEEKLLTVLWAAPASGIGDVSSALHKAGEYLERRGAHERRARAATVIVLCAQGVEEGPFAARAKEEALRLSKAATLLWVSPLEIEQVRKFLGFPAREAPAPPQPSGPRAAGREPKVLAR